jgi:DNA-directed RNA polymerase specialized sigma24 family protein
VGQDYLRKDKKFKSSIDQELLDSIEHAQEEVLTQMIWDDKVNLIKQVMEELSQQRDKEILTRFYFESEGKVSICSDLDLTSAHFDRVIFRAKQRLKALIDKQKNNPPPSKLSLVEEKKKKVSQRFISVLFKYTVNIYYKMTKKARFFA